MATTYPITDAQRQFLESFTCERLTASPSNQRLIWTFHHKDGGGLIQKLRETAWVEDRLGTTAYYVIKNAAGELVLFFSLKCGVLFDPNYVRTRMETYGTDDHEAIWDHILTTEEAALPQMQAIRKYDLRKLLIDMDENDDPVAQSHIITLWKLIGPKRFNQMLRDIHLYFGTKREKKQEPNQNIIRVPASFPAIELVEFCANEKTQGCWDKAAMGKKSMGKALFWWFIVPKMLEINELIGSQYVFLFAADHQNKLDQNGIGSLINYYRGLHFRNMPNLGTAKPLYDYNCQFMCQQLRTDFDGNPGLDRYRREFFDHFNQDTTASDYV